MCLKEKDKTKFERLLNKEKKLTNNELDTLFELYQKADYEERLNSGVI